MPHRESLEHRLETLREAHRALDLGIAQLQEMPSNQLLLQRLKKQKLRLRDEIETIENMLIPDVIA